MTKIWEEYRQNTILNLRSAGADLTSLLKKRLFVSVQIAKDRFWPTGRVRNAEHTTARSSPQRPAPL